MATPGGRMPASEGNRPSQAPGVGPNSKRHDLERRDTPYLHDSDLQQGDVQAMEQGQRVAPRQTQEAAAPRTASQGGGATSGPTSNGATVPDPIQFFAGRANGQVGLPQSRSQVDNSRAATWLPILRQLAAGPGSSGALASAIINQARALAAARQTPATIVDMNGADDALEAMLSEGI